jgi:outer membrane protein assembly factor BamB
MLCVLGTALAGLVLLVFDNGSRRGASRVVELDPETLEVSWQYPAEPGGSFFSRWRGGAQRLANGNTLITESEKGRVFEVTPAGEVVWEFWNPEVVDGQRKRIYRFHRVPRSHVEALFGAPGQHEGAPTSAPAAGS